MDRMSTEEALACEQARADAFAGGDAESLGKLLADELVFVHASGKVDSKQSYLEFVRSGAASYQGVDNSDMSVQIFDHVAVVNGIVSAKVMHEGVLKSPRNHFISTWVKRNGAAQLVAWQHTSAKPI